MIMSLCFSVPGYPIKVKNLVGKEYGVSVSYNTTVRQLKKKIELKAGMLKC